jgi:hypothetical protein
MRVKMITDHIEEVDSSTSIRYPQGRIFDLDQKLAKRLIREKIASDMTSKVSKAKPASNAAGKKELVPDPDLDPDPDPDPDPDLTVEEELEKLKTNTPESAETEE